TIIIRAGAIIVTFLFVLMPSAAGGPSDENDRSREPLLGSLGGFAFAGLVLFMLHEAREAATPSHSADLADVKRLTPLPAPVLLPEERHSLGYVADELGKLDRDAFYGDPAEAGMSRLQRADLLLRLQHALQDVVGADEVGLIRRGSIRGRIEDYRSDQQAKAVLRQAEVVRKQTFTAFARVD